MLNGKTCVLYVSHTWSKHEEEKKTNENSSFEWMEMVNQIDFT